MLSVCQEIEWLVVSGPPGGGGPGGSSLHPSTCNKIVVASNAINSLFVIVNLFAEVIPNCQTRSIVYPSMEERTVAKTENGSNILQSKRFDKHFRRGGEECQGFQPWEEDNSRGVESRGTAGLKTLMSLNGMR
jgi:hypothetical protein